MLAYSTISHSGLITLLLGMNSPLALVAAVFHMMNHATFKASLFMAAGISRSRNRHPRYQRLSGLAQRHADHRDAGHRGRRRHGGRAAVERISVEGDVLRRNDLCRQGQSFASALPAIATLASVFSVAYSLRFIHRCSSARVAICRARRTNPRAGCWLPSALLVIACLLVGIFPARTIGPLLRLAAASILGPPLPDYSSRFGTASRCRS